ncbi:MAG: LytTR family transcriptional regulator [Flavobacterium sp.]|nr:MAG: LytTR family transcriptional regulator [Flavobacterium sp.]
MLQPFDTSQFQDDNKVLLLSGYGILTLVVYVLHSVCENIWYYRRTKVWTVGYEIISTILFCVFTGTVLYVYNRFVVNDIGLTLATYWRFLSVTILCMTPVFSPVMLYLRQKLGERIVPPAQNLFRLAGENKNEILDIDKGHLIFVRAVENYVEICYLNNEGKVASKTFRQTLSNIWEQVPFVEKCHRSYLVNINMIRRIEGNSQGAVLSFVVGEKEIPLSKTYYKNVKGKNDLRIALV